MSGPIACPSCRKPRDESDGWYLIAGRYYCGVCAPRDLLLPADRLDVDLKYPRQEPR